MTVMRWYEQDEVNQEDSEQNEVDGMKKGRCNMQPSGIITDIYHKNETFPLVNCIESHV